MVAVKVIFSKGCAKRFNVYEGKCEWCLDDKVPVAHFRQPNTLTEDTDICALCLADYILSGLVADLMKEGLEAEIVLDATEEDLRV